MAAHEVYRSIVTAVRKGRLSEPFSSEDFRRTCPGFGVGTYQAFLWKHRKGNPGGNSELFVQAGRGTFRVMRPLRYDV
jgi:hypothetical protein